MRWFFAFLLFVVTIPADAAQTFMRDYFSTITLARSSDEVTTGVSINRAWAANVTALNSILTLNGLIKCNGSGTLSAVTDSSTNWNTAYTDRLKWDGGATGLTAATGRTSLGLGSAATATTAGTLQNDATLPTGAAVTTALGNYALTSALDPLAPADGTQNVTGNLTVTGEGATISVNHNTAGGDNFGLQFEAGAGIPTIAFGGTISSADHTITEESGAWILSDTGGAALTHDGSTFTAIDPVYVSAASTEAFKVGSGSDLIVDTTNHYVGVGMTPTVPLEVKTASTNALVNTINLYNASDGASAGTAMNFYSGSTKGVVSSIKAGYASGAYMAFFTGNSERVRINPSGYLGVGDSTPLSLLTVGDGDKFQVASTGSITITGFAKLIPQADPPGTPAAGMIYSDTDGHIYHYDGSNWDQLDN